MLPVDVRDALLTHARRGDLLEVVLDLGRCPEARFANGAPNQCLRAEPVTRGDLDAAIAAIGDFGGDNRAGIAGTLHPLNSASQVVPAQLGAAATGETPPRFRRSIPEGVGQSASP